jgi:hypothetical protein
MLWRGASGGPEAGVGQVPPRPGLLGGLCHDPGMSQPQATKPAKPITRNEQQGKAVIN